MIRKRFLVPVAFLFLAGCLFPLPDGSGIRWNAVPVHVAPEDMPDKVPPMGEQAADTILATENLATFLAGPLGGALLYQYVFRPLRKRREEKKGAK